MPFAPIILLALLCVLMPQQAHAYLDPGTGSAVIQMVVAGVMGALFVVKMYWRKLVGFFSGGEAPDVSEVSEAVEAAEGSAEASPARDERR